MIGTYRNTRRILEILKILAHHRVGPLAERFFVFRVLAWISGFNPATRRHRRVHNQPERLRMALEDLGPTFIKFGQMLSTRMDQLPEAVGQEMKKLQDNVPPFDFEEVKPIVEESLKGRLEDHFTRFDPKPVASASIAQVHNAQTRDGRQVAVKVMRPNASEQVEADLSILYSLARIIETYVPEWKRFHALKVVEEFSDTLRNEMDFHIEATHAQQLWKNFKNDSTLHVPEVYWNMTSRRVLTLEWVDGVPVSEYLRTRRIGSEPGPDPETVARNVITAFFNQVFRDGYFHADQHPGNIFVRSDGSVSIVDFGIVGHVTLQTRIWLADMLRGFLMRDYRKVAQVHIDAGYIHPDTDMDEFEEAARQVGEPVFGQPLKEISIARLLGQMFKVTERFQMEVQPQLLLLQKTMFTLEGVGREIYPDLNMWELSEPLVREWMKEHFGPKGVYNALHRDVKDLSHVAGYVPQLLYTGLARLAHDRMQMRLHPDFLRELESHLDRGFRRQAMAITIGLSFLSAAVLIAADSSPWLYMPILIYGGFSYLRSLLLFREGG
ncbi:MAG: 2-polyprenylphenol 6-hydroxylase [Magnetococcales bacterium]|nr:2-polyprenylphenol 6-hydroxylase [Magnetococcales bacterium]